MLTLKGPIIARSAVRARRSAATCIDVIRMDCARRARSENIETKDKK